MKVMVDPGHGGDDTGATEYSVYREEQDSRQEKDFVLGISHRLVALLRQRQQDPLMTRTWDRTVSLDDRVQQANRYDVDFFVSIHLNSFPEPIKNSGTSVFHWPGSRYGDQLSRSIIEQFDQKSPLGIRGVKQTDNRPDQDESPYLYVVGKTEMPAVLVECGFLSEPEDREWLVSNHGMYTCAESIFLGLMQTGGVYNRT